MRDAVLEHLSAALRERYLVRQQLGEGAAANVYLAEDLKYGRPVAIKVLRQALAEPAAAARFEREIRVLAQLQHPHIVPLFDSGDAAGTLYYVTAYVEGSTLRAGLSNAPANQLPVEEAVRLAREIGSALDYAHQRNVLHRDIKPTNILLQSGHALVADFGIARAIQMTGETRLSETGVAVGTPAYMSPEQLVAERALDARSDVFALGCVAYEMLAGTPPFMGVRGVVDNALKMAKPPKSLREYRPDLDARFDDVLLRALAVAPEDRFDSAGAFTAALERVDRSRR